MKIFFGEEGFARLSSLMEEYDKIFLLTDDRISRLYSSMFASVLSNKFIKIVIPEGERNKTIENVCYIWSQLIENKAGRDALLINLGGGTISDIGAFAASTYKRGIDFVNVPTTLLAMVDASIGGKNGVNFKNYKNQVGLFSEPQAIFINPHFIKTLDERDVMSGLAEMMKYAFIADSSFLDITKDNYLEFIEKAALLKEDVVSLDYNEQGFRKILNFGHTIGHAIESFYMEKPDTLTHGEAVALGMYSALLLSVKYCNLDPRYVVFYEKWLVENYKSLNVNDLDVEAIMELMLHDKKNIGGRPRFVLVSAPEKALIDIEVNEEDIRDSIIALKNLLKA